MRLLTFFAFLLLLITLTSPSQASDHDYKFLIDWPKDGDFDFCADNRSFELRNAYWLGAMSYYAYLNQSYVEQIFKTPYKKRFDLRLLNSKGRPNGTIRATGFGWPGSVDYFSNASPTPLKKSDIYRLSKNFVPDVQAFWAETDNLVIIAFRGTEQDNPIDWATDIAASFQVNHEFLPFWRRNVHKGFEQSLAVIAPWLEQKVNALFENNPNAHKIPIFLTGHSMGGALATLVMTTWLERNLVVAPQKRLNLKAVYTYGTPRIGNLNFATHFTQLATTEPVGLYRIVNKRDFVTKAPCIDYNHFGSHIQLLSGVQGNFPAADVKILVNPRSEEFNNCAYGSRVFENINHFEEYKRDHLIESYYSVLVTARHQLNQVLKDQAIEYDLRNNYPANNPFNPHRLPYSCKGKVWQIGAPAYLQFNNNSLPYEIEN